MDIAEELERHAKLVMPNYPDDVCSRAKAEIERLRATDPAWMREIIRSKLREATGYEWPKLVNELVAAISAGEQDG